MAARCRLRSCSGRATTPCDGREPRRSTPPAGVGVLQAEGGEGNDQISGSEAADTLFDGSGNDSLDARGGNDTYFGDVAGGDDTILGGAGDDGLNDGPGNDTTDGGDGNDIMIGNLQNVDASTRDLFAGGEGNDRLESSAVGGESHFDGWRRRRPVAVHHEALASPPRPRGATHSRGARAVMATRSSRQAQTHFPLTVDGGADTDSLQGTSVADVLTGGDGDDFVNGMAGPDDLAGGVGNDSVSGGSGDDVAHGSDGNDKVRGDAGSDNLFGDARGRRDRGRGAPTAFASSELETTPTVDTISCGEGTDAAVADPIDIVAQDCEGYGAA